jgi:hypothetical protein
MPQTYIFTDDKTGEKFQWDGGKWLPFQGPGAGDRAVQGIRQGVDEMVKQPISDVVSGFATPPQNLTEALSPVGAAPVRLAKAAYNDTKSTAEYPLQAIQQAREYIKQGKYAEASALIGSTGFGPLAKVLGPSAAQWISGVRKGGDLATPMGRDLTKAAIMALMARSPEIGTEAVRPPIQSYIGVGKTAENFARQAETENFAKLKTEHAELTKKIAGENAEELAKSRDIERQKIGDIDKQHAEATEAAKAKTEASKTGVAQRQQLTGEVQQSAKQLGDSLQTLREQETAVAKSLYPEVGGTADTSALHTQIQDAVEGGLKGSEKVPTVVNRILQETSPIPGKSTGPAIGGRTLDLSSAGDLAAYQRYKASGAFTPEEIARIEGKNAAGMTFDKLHGYYSELGKAAYALEGDERAATLAAKKIIGDQMEKMAAAENKSYRFNVAQKNWAKLENTWYNTAVKNGSPIARVLAAFDPVTRQIRPEYVQSILSDPKQYSIAQQMLSRYKGAGNAQAALQLMQEKIQQARGLPKTVKEAALPEKPTYPESTPVNLKKTPPAPTEPEFDPVEWRLKMIQERAKQLSGGFGRYESRPYGARYAPIQRALARFLANPTVQRWLAGAK